VGVVDGGGCLPLVYLVGGGAWCHGGVRIPKKFWGRREEEVVAGYG